MHEITKHDMMYARSLVLRCWRNANKSSLLYDELESAAMLGLVEAAKRYDESSRIPWFVYRQYRVRGIIKDVLRSEIEQGFIGLTGRGRNPKDDITLAGIHAIDDEITHIATEDDLEYQYLIHQCQQAAIEYIIGCTESTAIKLVAIILAGGEVSSVARILGCSRAALNQLVIFHKKAMVKFIRDKFKLDETEKENI